MAIIKKILIFLIIIYAIAISGYLIMIDNRLDQFDQINNLQSDMIKTLKESQ